MPNAGLPIYVRVFAFVFLAFGAYHEYHGIWFNRIEPMTANMVEMWHDMMGVVNTAVGLLLLAVHLAAKRIPHLTRKVVVPARRRARSLRRVAPSLRVSPPRAVLAGVRAEEA